mmetsp:Transcript_26427/g.54807  ORF Transcript_26427/g.54807 Transcript_26427/m.54807 type:complete len:120 (+) Transcript_26427:181-540(+)
MHRGTGSSRAADCVSRRFTQLKPLVTKSFDVAPARMPAVAHVGPLLADCEGRGQPERECELLELLAQGALRPAVLHAIALRRLEAAGAEGALPWLERLRPWSRSGRVSLRVCHAAAAPP